MIGAGYGAPGTAEAEARAAVNEVYLGFQACTKCGCKEFEGNAGTCGNSGCGHAFADHW